MHDDRRKGGDAYLTWVGRVDPERHAALRSSGVASDDDLVHRLADPASRVYSLQILEAMTDVDLRDLEGGVVLDLPRDVYVACHDAWVETLDEDERPCFHPAAEIDDVSLYVSVRLNGVPLPEDVLKRLPSAWGPK